jgi:hypothetical protein
VPHYHPVADLVDNSSSGQTFADGFLLPEAAYVVPLDPTVDPLTSSNDLSCAALNRPDTAGGGGNDVGPERINSAIIRLATRTEHTDQGIDFQRGFGGGGGRLVRYNLAPYYKPDGGMATEKPGSAYKLKTMVAEVALINIAGRTDLTIQR